jgi:hypothetical protein
MLPRVLLKLNDSVAQLVAKMMQAARMMLKMNKFGLISI